MSYYEGVVDDFIIIDLKTLGISHNEVLKLNYIKDLIKSIPNLNFDDTFWLSKVNEMMGMHVDYVVEEPVEISEDN